jgi:purine-binding chemotaxis protein CheW
MKQKKTKKTVLKMASKRRAGERPSSDNLDALRTTGLDKSSNAGGLLPDRQEETSTKALEMPAAGKTGPEPGAVEPSEEAGLDPSDTSAAGTASIGNILQRLAFSLGDEEYGIDIRIVKEIIRPTGITPVPRAPSYIRGIISLRGTVLPILDLCQLLSMTNSRPTKTQRIVVVGLEDMLVGIIVDAVTEVVELREEELQPATALMGSITANHITGMSRYKGRLIILLDLEKVYLARHDLAKAQQERPHAHSN